MVAFEEYVLQGTDGEGVGKIVNDFVTYLAAAAKEVADAKLVEQQLRDPTYYSKELRPRRILKGAAAPTTKLSPERLAILHDFHQRHPATARMKKTFYRDSFGRLQEGQPVLDRNTAGFGEYLRDRDRVIKAHPWSEPYLMPRATKKNGDTVIPAVDHSIAMPTSGQVADAVGRNNAGGKVSDAELNMAKLDDAVERGNYRASSPSTLYNAASTSKPSQPRQL